MKYVVLFHVTLKGMSVLFMISNVLYSRERHSIYSTKDSIDTHEVPL